MAAAALAAAVLSSRDIFPPPPALFALSCAASIADLPKFIILISNLLRALPVALVAGGAVLPVDGAGKRHADASAAIVARPPRCSLTPSLFICPKN